MNYRNLLRRQDPRLCRGWQHRGIRRDAPKNSLSAIERAIAEGYDVVETTSAAVPMTGCFAA